MFFYLSSSFEKFFEELTRVFIIIIVISIKNFIKSWL